MYVIKFITHILAIWVDQRVHQFNYYEPYCVKKVIIKCGRVYTVLIVYKLMGEKFDKWQANFFQPFLCNIFL